MDWWVTSWLQISPVFLICWIVWVLLSICLHELAHGWAAIWQGDDTPIIQNRMTLNPLVHMGGPSLLMFAICGIAWGAMPVNPYKFRWRRYGDVMVSGAGPAMNLLIAIITMTTYAVIFHFVSGNPSNFLFNIHIFLWSGAYLNIVLAVFNLVPVPPLDGSRILASLSYKAEQFYAQPQVQNLSLFALLILFFWGSKYIFAWADAVFDWYITTFSYILP